MQTSSILVIGSTGKTGRRIIDRLAKRGIAVRHGSRGAEPPFDWQTPSTWPAALRGTKAVYISYYPDLAAPGAPQAIETLCAMAREAGVERLVLLSGRGEQHALRCEEIVRASGLAYTLIRASWFFQNFTEGHLLGPVLSGTLAMPAGDIREPFIDADDIADVAVAALTEEAHAGRLYEVTGPHLLSFAEACSEMAEAAGHEIGYLPISLEEFHGGLNDSAGPELARLLTDLCAEVLDGRNAALTDGVRQALGRNPRDFRDFCRDAAASGVWRRPG